MESGKIGKRIQEARKARGLTQAELSQLVDITPKYLSNIECGAKVPRLETFIAIANALGVSADELLVDVVDHATSGVASELSAAIEDLPHDEKMRILKAVSALVEK